MIVVLTSGSAIAANYAAERATAVLAAWYGGEEAGSAIADTLAGCEQPGGPSARDVLHERGSAAAVHGLRDEGTHLPLLRRHAALPLRLRPELLQPSAYADLSAKRTAAGAEIRATVKNTSARDGDEVVQLYVAGGPGDGAPIRSLRGFQRLRLKAGESRQVTFQVAAEDLPKASVEVSVGGGQPLAGIPHVKGVL